MTAPEIPTDPTAAGPNRNIGATRLAERGARPETGTRAGLVAMLLGAVAVCVPLLCPSVCHASAQYFAD